MRVDHLNLDVPETWHLDFTGNRPDPSFLWFGLARGFPPFARCSLTARTGAHTAVPDPLGGSCLAVRLRARLRGRGRRLKVVGDDGRDEFRADESDVLRRRKGDEHRLGLEEVDGRAVIDVDVCPEVFYLNSAQFHVHSHNSKSTPAK